MVLRSASLLHNSWFEAEIEKLNQHVEKQTCERCGARLLMTHLGVVGPVAALQRMCFWAIQNGSLMAKHWLVTWGSFRVNTRVGFGSGSAGHSFYLRDGNLEGDGR